MRGEIFRKVCGYFHCLRKSGKSEDLLATLSSHNISAGIPRGLKFDQFDGFKRIGALSPVEQRHLGLSGTQQDKASPSGKPLGQEVGDPFMLGFG